MNHLEFLKIIEENIKEEIENVDEIKFTFSESKISESKYLTLQKNVIDQFGDLEKEEFVIRCSNHFRRGHETLDLNNEYDLNFVAKDSIDLDDFVKNSSGSKYSNFKLNKEITSSDFKSLIRNLIKSICEKFNIGE